MKWWKLIALVWPVLDRIVPNRIIHKNRPNTPRLPWWRRLCWKRGRFMQIIMDREGKTEYMIRYYLWNTRWIEPLVKGLMKIDPRAIRLAKLSTRTVLHHVKRGDEDGFHDHPWNWSTRLIEGRYIEERPGPNGTTRQVFTPESPRRSMRATDFHRLSLDPSYDGEVWTIFTMGLRHKEWGFLDATGTWIQHDEYIKNRSRYFAGR